MAILLEKNREQRDLNGVVWMGMVDSKLADAYLFMIDLDENIFYQIRKERTVFLRFWLMHSSSKRPPEINLFFGAPNDEWFFVKNSSNHRGLVKRLVLNDEALEYPYVICSQVREAYEYVCSLQEKALLIEQGNENRIVCKVLQFSMMRK